MTRGQPWHQHHHPYLIVPLTDGANEMRFADRRSRNTTETEGSVMWREAGILHELYSRSSWQYRNVLIEFKTSPATAQA